MATSWIDWVMAYH